MIYLDNNATTPVDPRVLEVMLPLFMDHFGNAASRQHRYGWIAADAVDIARQQVAKALDVEPGEIIFTSGATESCNLAIKGVWELYQGKGRHIVAVTTEHKAVLDPCDQLRKRGAEITWLKVDASGRINLEELRNVIRDDTVMVCAMWANNETGVLNSISDIGEICAQSGTLLFSDATQTVGKIPVKPRQSGVQLLALSGHKIHGPKGVGALYVSGKAPRVKIEPLIKGGGHENGLRSGTLNVPGIAGFCKAVELLESDRNEIYPRLKAMRDKLEGGLLAIEGSAVNGDLVNRLGHVSNIRFSHVDSGALMADLQDDLALAAGSACTSADPSPSHVLTAMGLSASETKSSVRFSLGRYNTMDEMDRCIALVSASVAKLRERSQSWRMFRDGLI